MKKIIVTGGLGFIGSHLVDSLVALGHEVHIVDNREDVPAYLNKKAYLHNVCVTEYNELVKIFKDAEYVFHFAALPRVQFSIKNPIDTNRINIGGTVSVLKAASDVGVKRVIYSASSSAYGDQKQMPLVESLPPNPMSPYAIQKYTGELYCKSFYLTNGIETVSLRYFNVYGDRQSLDGEYACVIGKFLEQKKSGVPLTVTGDGLQTRDFTHVSDVVQANLFAMESDKVGSGEVINIGAGESIRILDLARAISESIVHIPLRIEPYDTRASYAKAKELLGWEPKISWQKGISDLK